MVKIRHCIVLCAALLFVFAGCASNDKEEAPGTSQSLQSSSGTSTQTTTQTQSSSQQGSQSSATSSSSLQGSGAQKDAYAGLTDEQIMALVEQSRKAAIDAGAKDAAPQVFSAAEQEYRRLKQALASGSGQNITEALKNLDLRYKGLAALSRAKQKKALIDQNGYAKYAQKAYDDGSALLAEVSDPAKASAMSGADFNAKASRADSAFGAVLNAASKALGYDVTKQGAGGAGSGTAQSGDPYAGLSNEQILGLIEKSRQAALDSGAPEADPKGWALAEAEYAKQKAAIASGTKENLSAALRDLDMRYKGLDALAKAKEKKARIDSLDFAKYAKRDYDSGVALIAELDALEDPASISGKDYYGKAGKADSDLSKVLRAGYNALATDARTSAYKAKLKADEVKAYISRKTDYDHAVSLYKNGETRRATNPQIAYESYTSAANEFTVLYEEISKARAAAQARIDAAKERVAQSESNAVEADKEVPLGDEVVEGIVAPDAKLLEDDDFSDANQATELENPLESAQEGGE